MFLVWSNYNNKNITEFKKYNILSKYNLRNLILEKSLKIKTKLIKYLKYYIDNKIIYLVTDIWTYNFTNIYYINLLCTIINVNSGELKNKLLRIIPFKSKKYQ